ncbi:ABC transporter permease [bacterium]
MIEKNLKILPIIFFLLHLLVHIFFGINNWIQPFEFFNIILLLLNMLIALYLYYNPKNIPIGLCIMLITLGHSFIGARIAGDALTSGSILVVNILIIYVGFKIYEELPLRHFIVFILSYLLLFFVFIKMMQNAQPLFLLALLGLAATIRNFKLLTYFWALILSFTFCQPYGWQAAGMLFFLFTILFSIKSCAKSPATIIFFICGLLLVFFVLFPIFVLITQEDFRSIFNVLKDLAVKKAIITTLITSSISIVILLIFFVPLAYVLSRFEFKGKIFLLSLIDLPIIIPQSAAGIALLQIFGKNQYIGETFFNIFGIRFDGTLLGICLAQIFVAMPFMIKSALAAFDSIPISLEQNARTLGANSIDVFRYISLPLASKGVMIGTIIAWARACGEFGAVFFIASHPATAPVAVYNRFTSVGLTETAPLVAALTLFSIVIFFVLQFVLRSIPSMYKQDFL